MEIFGYSAVSTDSGAVSFRERSREARGEAWEAVSFCESQAPKRGEQSRRRLYLVTRVVNLQGESTESDVVVAASNKFYSSRMAPFKEANCTLPPPAPSTTTKHAATPHDLTHRQVRIRPAGPCVLRWGSLLAAAREQRLDRIWAG